MAVLQGDWDGNVNKKLNFNNRYLLEVKYKINSKLTIVTVTSLVKSDTI